MRTQKGGLEEGPGVEAAEKLEEEPPRLPPPPLDAGRRPPPPFPPPRWCTLAWRLRSSDRANRRPHTSHPNGFSPVCVLSVPSAFASVVRRGKGGFGTGRGW